MIFTTFTKNITRLFFSNNITANQGALLQMLFCLLWFRTDVFVYNIQVNRFKLQWKNEGRLSKRCNIFVRIFAVLLFSYGRDDVTTSTWRHLSTRITQNLTFLHYGYEANHQKIFKNTTTWNKRT